MSDKYKPPAGRLLEFCKSDSSIEADEDTGGDARDGGAAKPRCRTMSPIGKQSASAVAAAISAVKTAEKNRKRKATSSPAVVITTIPTPRSREVESEEEEEEEKEKDEAIEELSVTEDRSVRRSESPAAKR
jgi:hypothetical protein